MYNFEEILLDLSNQKTKEFVKPVERSEVLVQCQ